MTNKKQPPVHDKLDYFKSADGQLQVNGIPLPQLVERVGQTPFYAYDRSVIDTRIAKLRTELPSEIKLHYAMKANPMPVVVQHFAQRVDGLDVASAGELQVALDTGMAPEQISFAGPGKRDAELHTAIAAGITLNVESPNELERIAGIAEQTGYRPHIALRVNPDFELKTSGMKMGGGPKQFGIDAEQIPGVLRRVAELDLDFAGFHIFSGSQNLRPEAIIEAHDKTFALAFRLTEDAPGPLRHLNIGGGFGIPYFPGDKHLELTEISANLADLLQQSAEYLGATEIVIELGRYLIGEAGIYICRVIDRKLSRGQVFLICDGGLHHHLANSGNFGQVIRKNYPVIIGNRMDAGELETVNIVGPLCTPLDIIAHQMELPRADVGDLVVVLQSGAYGLTASPRGFLSQPDAMEVLV